MLLFYGWIDFFSLFLPKAGCYPYIWGNLAHIQLERIAIVSLQLSQLGSALARRTMEFLFLNWARIGGELNNRLQAIRTGKRYFFRFHKGPLEQMIIVKSGASTNSESFVHILGNYTDVLSISSMLLYG